MIIVEIGAYHGQAFSLPYAQVASNVVYAIEPNLEYVEQLRSHSLPNLHVICAAVNETDGMADLSINRDSQTSSLLIPKLTGGWLHQAERFEEITSIAVPTVRLDTLIREYKLTEIDLLKIDAQGSELPILKSAENEIHRIRHLVLKVQVLPLYPNQATKAEIVQYLNQRGFQQFYTSILNQGLEENLEFVRVDRRPAPQTNSDYFDVDVPHVGTLRTPANDHVGQLLASGSFEGCEQAFLWLYLRPNDVVFDCGSHVGLFSCIAAKRLDLTGKIVGFDPNPTCSTLYKQNLKALGYADFYHFNVGLSNIEGAAEFQLGAVGKSAFGTFAKNHLSGQSAIVPQRTLDSVVDELEVDQIQFAKLDVEGWEPFVIKGATRSIQARKFPVWMIEFTEANAIAAGSSTQALWTLLEEFGYTLCRFDALTLRLVPEPPRLPYAYDNLFAVQDLAAVNHRLATAAPEFGTIAQDIIARWDRANALSTLQQQLIQVQHVASELGQQAQSLHEQFHSLCAELDQCRQQHDQATATIAALQDSKLWKLRNYWLKLKRLLSFTVDNLVD